MTATATDPAATASAEEVPLNGTPGSATDLGTPWEELGFEYRRTSSFVKMQYRDGEWGAPELERGEPYVPVHIGATALHYGQACFEGLKAFTHEDGRVAVFRPLENAKRLRSSCERIVMPPLSDDLFLSAVRAAVRDNIAYVPPYGSGGSLYLRPLLFGSGARIGLQPADEYTFLLMVIPVGDYYAGGLAPVDALVVEGYDRAAAQGVGDVKVAGNYAADMRPNMESKDAGYPISLYLDASTRTMVEEFSTSNFVGIVNGPDGKCSGGKFVTPGSSSVLPSITNKSLMQIAGDEGMEVQRRDILTEELGSFDEVAACGTAVVVTPVGRIKCMGTTHEYGGGTKVGDTTRMLYDRVREVQFGQGEDKFGWLHFVN